MQDGKNDIESISRTVAGRLSRRSAGDCPETEILAAYMEGCAAQETREQVEAHLAECDDCRVLMAECALARLQSSDSPVPLPLEFRAELLGSLSGCAWPSIPHLVYRVATNLLELVNGPETLRRTEPAPVRGGRLGTAHRLLLGGYEVDAAVDCRRDGKFELWLRMGPLESVAQPCDWQVWKDSSLLEQQPAEGGEVLFTNLDKGSYRCVLRLGGREVAAMKLTMEDRGK
jgi:hypothetical protein